MNLIKIKNFGASSDTIRTGKRQPTEEEEMFVDRKAGRGLCL